MRRVSPAMAESPAFLSAQEVGCVSLFLLRTSELKPGCGGGKLWTVRGAQPCEAESSSPALAGKEPARRTRLPQDLPCSFVRAVAYCQRYGT